MNRRLFLIFHGRFPSEKAAGLFAEESARAFTGQGYEVTVLAPRRRVGGGGGAVYLPTLDFFGLIPNVLAFRISFFAFSVSTYVYLFFRARRDDLIYSNEPLPLLFASFSFPNVAYELHDYPEANHWLYRLLFARIQAIVVTNRGKEEQLHAQFPRTRDKTFVETNAVSLSQFSTAISKAEARASLHLPHDQKIVVYTGHLYAWKGVDTLAYAARLLGDTAHVYVVGGTLEDITRYKKRWGQIPNLHIVGYRPHEEIPLWQRAADVLVLPNTAREVISARDTSPMKLFEYMASGTPIVASRLPSILEILQQDEAAFVTPDDEVALAEGLRRTLADPHALARAERALRSVAVHTWEQRAARITNWVATLPDRSKQYRHERTIFYSSLAVTFFFLGAYIVTHGLTPSFADVASDGYVPLAISLYERGVFSYSTTTPYVLEGAHAPGYPLFLAFTAAPWGTVLPTLLFQAFFLAYTSVLLYRLFEGVFVPRVRLFGALVFAIEPYTAFTAVQPLSEALFLALLIGGFLVLRRAFEREQTSLFFIAGVFLACSALVRPIALYLVPLTILAVLVLAIVKSPRRAFGIALAFVFGALLVLMPWAYRNHEAVGVWALSIKGPYSVYFYYAAAVLEYRGEGSAIEVTTKLIARATAKFPEVHTQDDLRSPRYASFLTSESLVIISESPLLFAKMYAISLGTFFLSDGYRLLWYEISQGAITLPNITRAIATGDLSTIVRYFKDEPAQALLFFIGFFFWASTFLLAAVGSIAGVISGPLRMRLTILASLAIITYFALLTGPLAQARYRIVVTPFLFMLASYGAAICISHFYHAHRRFS